MKQILMLMGPPASGKTTRAHVLLERFGAAAVRVNQDDIRRELGWTSWDTWDFKGASEKLVYIVKRNRIVEALKNPDIQIVISDDTNLKAERRSELEAIAKQFDATVVIERFDTPLEECLRRDAARPANEQVGEKVIRRMYADMQASKMPEEPRKVDIVPGLPNAIICDLDGTLADHEGRRGVYDFAQCANDALKAPIAAVVEQFWHGGPHRPQIIFMSGREERFRPQTMEFLRQHQLADAGPLYMRRTYDRRNDAIVKSELFDAHIRGQYNVLFCLDDRDRIVKLWRDMGLTCLQVAYGAF
jgi:predicted kinase